MDAMHATGRSGPRNWVANLHRFARESKAAAATEACELCAAPLGAIHPHLVEPSRGRLLCVCRSCATLLGDRDDKKYRAVPETAHKLEDFDLSDAEWEATGIPVGLAFFFFSTVRGRIVAFYPGPAGPTESLLDLHAWTALAERNPALMEMEPDVEALLVNRVNAARGYYRMPIDRCYELVGLIRSHWRGVTGGAEAWSAVDSFFAGLGGGPGRSRLHG